MSEVEENVIEVVPVNELVPPEKTFSLKPVLDEKGNYTLTKFPEIKARCEAFIEENKMTTIKSADDLKALKKNRTALRKQKDFLKKVRTTLTKLFSWQFQELEKMLDAADNDLKTLKDEYEASLKANEEPAPAPALEQADTVAKEVTLKITYYNSTIVEEIIKLAKDNGCTVVEIERK